MEVEFYGHTVIDVIVPGELFLVRMKCCGAELELSMYKIKQRHWKGSKRCTSCYLPARRSHEAFKRNKLPRRPRELSDYGVALPTWDKPPSVPTGRGKLR